MLLKLQRIKECVTLGDEVGVNTYHDRGTTLLFSSWGQPCFCSGSYAGVSVHCIDDAVHS